MSVPTAQLRVFLPLAELDERDRLRWSPPRADALGVRQATEAEAELGRTRLVTGRGGFADRAVLTRRVGDEVFVCPLQLDVRSALALRQLRGEVPAPVVDLLLPDGEVRARLDAVAASGRVPTIVDAPWSVPLAWFALFDDTERRLRNPPEGAGPRLTYLTTAARALPRLERVVEALADAVEDADDLVDELADLLDWVASHPTRSLLELDYAGLVAGFAPDELQEDHSCRDVWSAVEGLETGDLVAALAYHAAVEERWRPHRARARAS